MIKQELIWLSKRIKNVQMMTELSNKPEELTETLMNYINLCSGNINMNIIEKIIYSDSLIKAKTIAKVASNTNFISSNRRTYEEKLALLEKIRNSTSDFSAENIGKILTNVNINKRRTYNEQVKLIDIIDNIKDEDCSRIITDVSINSELLKKKNSNEQMMFAKMINEEESNLKKLHMQSIVTSSYLLKRWTSIEIVEFLNKVKKCQSDAKVIYVSNYILLGLRTRSFYEQIDVIDEIINSQNDKVASYIEYISSNPILLFSLSASAHKRIIQKINEAGDDSKACCMALVVLNHFSITNKNIDKQLSLMEKIDSLEDEDKVDCIKDFASKTDFFYTGDYEEQEKLCEVISGYESDTLNEFSDIMNTTNIPARIILSSSEFNKKKNKPSLYENMKKYSGYERQKVKTIDKKI